MKHFFLGLSVMAIAISCNDPFTSLQLDNNFPEIPSNPNGTVLRQLVTKVSTSDYQESNFTSDGLIKNTSTKANVNSVGASAQTTTNTIFSSDSKNVLTSLTTTYQSISLGGTDNTNTTLTYTYNSDGTVSSINSKNNGISETFNLIYSGNTITGTHSINGTTYATVTYTLTSGKIIDRIITPASGTVVLDAKIAYTGNNISKISYYTNGTLDSETIFEYDTMNNPLYNQNQSFFYPTVYSNIFSARDPKSSSITYLNSKDLKGIETTSFNNLTKMTDNSGITTITYKYNLKNYPASGTKTYPDGKIANITCTYY